MTIRRAIVYVVFFAAAASLWLFTHSERAQIKRVFADVERLASKEPSEPVFESIARSQALSRHFKDGCLIVHLGYGLRTMYSREDIAGGMLLFRSASGKIAVAFRELDVSVEGGKARVQGCCDYSGSDSTWQGFKPRSEIFSANLEKLGGKWLVSKIKFP